MLRHILLAAAVASGASAALTSCSYTQVAYTAPADDYAYEDDYDEGGEVFFELSAYGAWLETDAYGRVWQPRAVHGWQPYFHGHWAWTKWGWTWVSYEPFGWATYHYGNWYYDPTWGWIWVPGHRWYPHRVKWVVYGDYVCWAPVPPRGYYIGDPWSVHISVLWVSVDANHFTASNVGRYKVRDFRPTPGRTATIVRKAPDVKFIERRTKQTIRPVDIKVKEISRGGKEYKKVSLPPGQKKKVDHYKPRVERRVIKSDGKGKTGSSKSPPAATKPGTKKREPAPKTEKSGKEKKKKGKRD